MKIIYKFEPHDIITGERFKSCNGVIFTVVRLYNQNSLGLMNQNTIHHFGNGEFFKSQEFIAEYLTMNKFEPVT